MKETAMKRIKNTVLASLLALTLVATAPLVCFAEGEAVVPQNTQQDRIIAHAMEHQGQKFKKISDRNKGIKIDYGKAWCAWFIEHCSYQCKLGSIIPSKSKSDFAVGPLSRDLVNNKKATITFVNKKMWNKRKGDYNKSRRSYDKNYKPRKGDIVVYANYQVTGSYWLSHIGFVYDDCENALKDVKTVEGNTMGAETGSWEKTSIVGVREAADDKNKERRIAAYITPNYCKHKNINKETGVCKNSKCKANYYYFDNADTSQATNEEAGVTYKVIVDPENDASGCVRKYPATSGNLMLQYSTNAPINVLGTVKNGKWYKVSYTTAAGTTKIGYVAKKWIKQDDNITSTYY